jgi:hypothetical protein
MPNSEHSPQGNQFLRIFSLSASTGKSEGLGEPITVQNSSCHRDMFAKHRTHGCIQFLSP